MDNAKVDEALRSYLNGILHDAEPRRHPPDEPLRSEYHTIRGVLVNDLSIPPIKEASAAHLRWMAEEALSWPADRLEKKFRWLGFIQGALWRGGDTTVAAAKEINRPGGPND